MTYPARELSKLSVASSLLPLVCALALPARAQEPAAAVGGSRQAAVVLVDQYKTILPHVVFGGGWHNRFMFLNYNGTSASVRLYFYGNDGSAMIVPIKNFGSGSAVDVYLQGWGRQMIETGEGSSDELHQGWAQAVVSCSTSPCQNVMIFGVFATAQVGSYPVFEATVPASDSRSSTDIFPFDNRNGFLAGIAVVAHDCTSSSASVLIDFKYADEPSGSAFHQYQVPMTCPGHTSFALPTFNPLSQNRLGFVEVFSNAAKVSAIALLFNPNGGAHTTIPAMEYIP